MGYQDHKAAAGQHAVACAVITCSDSRTDATDDSGRLIRQLLESHGHTHPVHRILRDDPDAIRSLLDELCARSDIQAVILNGGTGVSRRDNTFDAVSAKLHKILPGFGELFRMLSYQSIGSGAMLSRAVGGIILTPAPTQQAAPGTQHAVRHTLIFSIPGSPNAVELAMNKLILPELPHLVWEVAR
ncbi:MAG TPA: MogA/MoaB family molybdenum cofactor biosynthesis protein [Phycisphaerae bacterium]|nr:MogA/MoaB family molybdenum cofactor biosynthesis protein [Phycisphaerae bacterium]